MWNIFKMQLTKILKILMFTTYILVVSETCSPKPSFDEFIENFPPINLPLRKISELTSKDTLSGKLINELFFHTQKEKPKYVDKEGNINIVNTYVGLYPDEPFKYTTDKKIDGKWIEFDHYYYSKIRPIGQVSLNKNYVTLLIKVVGFETTYYDLWNFTKDGDVISVVCIFWGMRDNGPIDEKVTYTIVDSHVTTDGNITWNEKIDGLITSRVYSLNSEGFFEIKKEEIIGEAQY